MADDDDDKPSQLSVSSVVRQAARTNWRAALELADRAEQQRELERLRELTTDARS